MRNRRQKRTTTRERIGADRAKTLAAFDHLISEGFTIGKAARILRKAPVTLWRWRQRRSTGRDLRPDIHLCGRTSALKQLGITPAMIDQVQRLVLKTGTVRAAWREFAKSKACPPQIAYALQAHDECEALPPSLTHAVPKIEVRRFVEFRGRNWTVRVLEPNRKAVKKSAAAACNL